MSGDSTRWYTRISSINSWASMLAQGSSGDGGAADARQRSLPLVEDGLHFPLAQGAPDDDDDVEGGGQLRQHDAERLSYQPPRAVALDGASDFARRGDAEP
jgi:hypothetical protein